MNPQEIPWESSLTDGDEWNNVVPLLELRPFHVLEDEPSDEVVSVSGQDDPFKTSDENKENPVGIASKTGAIIFRSRTRTRPKQSWSRDSLQGSGLSPLVRSAEVLSTGKNHYTLPTTGHGGSDNIMRITALTAVALLNGLLKRDFIFVDARYRYEYEGGHIRGAIRAENENEMRWLIVQKKIIIFYCEFSSVRGPSLALRFRNLDRQINTYPRLHCPEMYVLEGGYRNFFMNYPSYCTPSSYIMMHDERHKVECAQEYLRKRVRKR